MLWGAPFLSNFVSSSPPFGTRVSAALTSGKADAHKTGEGDLRVGATEHGFSIWELFWID